MKNRYKAIIGIVLILILLIIGFLIVRIAGNVLRNADINMSERDPMFAEPAETVTRPPELDAETTQPPHPTLDDYVPAEESPVDKTAAELAQEARGNT